MCVCVFSLLMCSKYCLNWISAHVRIQGILNYPYKGSETQTLARVSSWDLVSLSCQSGILEKHIAMISVLILSYKWRIDCFQSSNVSTSLLHVFKRTYGFAYRFIGLDSYTWPPFLLLSRLLDSEQCGVSIYTKNEEHFVPKNIMLY